LSAPFDHDNGHVFGRLMFVIEQLLQAADEVRSGTRQVPGDERGDCRLADPQPRAIDGPLDAGGNE
jgi:hypothetical protein